MEFSARVDAVRREGAALAAAARAAGVDARVPSCPGWDVGDLLSHIGRIHRWVTHLVETRAVARGAHWSEAEPPSRPELVEWFAQGVPPLAGALTAAGPASPAWTWTDDRTAGFWARRQAVETAIHRYDAQLAAGRAEPLAPAVALDGIDEMFALIPYWQRADQVRGDGETLHFHCTDGDGEWLVRLHANGLDVAREHAKGDVAARGTASDLLLFLYGRVGADALEVFGDGALLARWRELVQW
jgi:uncharacterized protein (TIGR03083 family)